MEEPVFIGDSGQCEVGVAELDSVGDDDSFGVASTTWKQR